MKFQRTIWLGVAIGFLLLMMAVAASNNFANRALNVHYPTDTLMVTSGIQPE